MRKTSGLLLMLVLVLMSACGSYSSNKDANKKTPESASTAPTANSTTANNAGTPPKDVKVLKFGTVATKDHPSSRAARHFGELLEKYSGGTLKVDVHTDGSLGGDVQLLEAMRGGTVQAAAIATAPVANLVPKFNVFDLPFLFKDAPTAYALLDGPIGKEMLGELSASGLIGIAFQENGFRHLTNNKRDVTSLKDIKGLKIRTQENKLHLDTWKALGANPTPMAFTEVFTALEQKVIDGQENPWANIRYNNFYEVQKHMTLTGHVYAPQVLLISKMFWDKLTPEQQQAIKKAGEETTPYQRQLTQEDDKESRSIIEKSGTKIIELTPEARKEIVDSLKPIYDKYKAEIGADLVDKVLAAVK